MLALHPTSERFRRAALDLLWAQWTAIGVAGVQAASRSSVDPEALVVATAEFGRWDARLFDEMLDWLVTNATLVDLARLRRLAALQPEWMQRLLSTIAQFVAIHSARRGWLVVAKGQYVREHPGGSGGAEPLFLPTGGGDTWGEFDALFLASGFQRNPPVLRGMSQSPDATSPACVRFRARALTGLGARAEVLTYLWTHEWSHGRLIGERGLYAKSMVAAYLIDLSATKLASRREQGRRVLYRLGPELAAVGQPAPVYVDWALALRGAATIWRELQTWPPVGAIGHALLSRLVQTLVAARPGLAAEGFEYHLPELHAWAAREDELPVQVVEGVVRRVAAFVG